MFYIVKEQVRMSKCTCVSEDGVNEVIRSDKDMEKGVYLSLGDCQTDHTLTGPPPTLR